ncbi:MAG: response regulator transcription factor [Anaerolineales bacterium]
MNSTQRGSALASQEVLIVEDHQGLREELQTWLGEEFPGTAISASPTGEEAWERIEQNGILLVLMDINLPGVDGLALTQRIKASHPEIGVIILTVYEDALYRLEASEAGADGFVLKKNMNRELIGKMKKVMKSRNGWD